MNKSTKLFAFAAIFSLIAASLTSCNSDSPSTTDEVLVAVSLNVDVENYNEYGYWNQTYNPEIESWGIAPGVLFSHYAQVSTYEGVEYKSFVGFVPSSVDDQSDHTKNGWVENQFASIASPGGQGYAIAHWDVQETQSTPVEKRSCLINFLTTVKPINITITNTAYAYYDMINGSAFSKPMDADGYLALDIYGVKKGQAHFNQTVYLYKNGEIVTNWKLVDLTGLGDVEQMFFTMRSSDTGEWGMNTPAYFAIGSMNILYPGVAVH